MITWPLAELLPHAGDMILIDQVESFDEEQIHTHPVSYTHLTLPTSDLV